MACLKPVVCEAERCVCQLPMPGREYGIQANPWALPLLYYNDFSFSACSLRYPAHHFVPKDITLLAEDLMSNFHQNLKMSPHIHQVKYYSCTENPSFVFINYIHLYIDISIVKHPYVQSIMDSSYNRVGVGMPHVVLGVYGWAISCSPFPGSWCLIPIPVPLPSLSPHSNLADDAW